MTFFGIYSQCQSSSRLRRKNTDVFVHGQKQLHYCPLFPTYICCLFLQIVYPCCCSFIHGTAPRGKYARNAIASKNWKNRYAFIHGLMALRTIVRLHQGKTVLDSCHRAPRRCNSKRVVFVDFVAVAFFQVSACVLRMRVCIMS